MTPLKLIFFSHGRETLKPRIERRKIIALSVLETRTSGCVSVAGAKVR